MPRNKIIPYNKNLKAKARELRKNMTRSEVILWDKIRGKKLGLQFHRQVPILEYIVDFYCHELLLVIEVDGSSHDTDEAYKYDISRQKAIEEWGVRFLRFRDEAVKQDLGNVMRTLEYWIEEYEKEKVGRE